ncbi:hypothetical protein OV207_10310 [Corallococcus sp. BB11-1]|uniref:MXAN_6577-like cysteine-rich protein n=1 Tax=Corallococcus sp. BB11-1 TaxID=2996783 RepID=UPI00226EB8B7|nr:MXAN_6577-like cysteine-rich protein [Corallococcus sp. BB11-1]MCY1031848.1 hypothetical protein [Corallococcus sp. BB11-1]
MSRPLPDARSRWLTLLVSALVASVLTGCPEEKVLCTSGLDVCGSECADLQGDPFNCGGCGVRCGEGETCQAGACECRTGAPACGEACLDLSSDARNCGACGNACPADQVCSAGACAEACPPGSERCNGGCAVLASDPLNCGACGTVCPDVQSCHAGRCMYDVVAACYTNGQLVGIQAGTDRMGPRRQFGSGVQSLAAWDGVVLAADAARSVLSQALAGALGAVVEEDSLGAVASSPNDILVDPPYVYVLDSVNNTLQVLKRDGPAQGGGLGLRTVGQVNLGANTSPQVIAKRGDTFYIPLFGTAGSDFRQGNAVARVNVSDPERPRLVDSIPLTGLDLKSFDGGTTMALPYAAVSTDAGVYVALTNLNPANDYLPNGPGMLARIDPADGGVRAIDLGAQDCLNAGDVQAVGEHLVVSCLGEARFDTAGGYQAKDVRATGLVLVKDDRPVASYALSPGCAGGPEQGCDLAVGGRLAVVGNAVYVTDVNAGRVFVVEVRDGKFVERRGNSTPEAKGAALDACPVDPRRVVSNAIDIVAVP